MFTQAEYELGPLAECLSARPSARLIYCLWFVQSDRWRQLSSSGLIVRGGRGGSKGLMTVDS